MNERIDVLAAIDDLLACAEYNASGGYEIGDDCHKVRAAVAELIAAVSAFENSVTQGAEREARDLMRVALTRVGA